ncbi:threonylcarbamoyladenosine tRNA methylthiotransferase, partial [Paragonimus heterotremus]
PPFTDPGAVNGCGSLTIATDIICGFPNETETDFDETVRLIERFQFPVLYINQFFARPGTPAATMPRKATTADVKKRTRRLHDLFRTYMPYADRVGAQVRVLVTEISHDGRFWVGHTKAYEQVLVPKLPDLMGHIVLVRITECDKFFMRSELIDPGPFDSLVFSSPCDSASSPVLPSLPELTRSAKPQLAQAKQPNTRNPSKSPGPNWVLRFGAILLLVYFALKLCESRGFFSWALST